MATLAPVDRPEDGAGVGEADAVWETWTAVLLLRVVVGVLAARSELFQLIWTMGA